MRIVFLYPSCQSVRPFAPRPAIFVLASHLGVMPGLIYTQQVFHRDSAKARQRRYGNGNKLTKDHYRDVLKARWEFHIRDVLRGCAPSAALIVGAGRMRDSSGACSVCYNVL
jgi:hypothetical protein